MKLTHVRLLVDDVRAGIGFYRDALGFELTEDFGDYVQLSGGTDVALALFPRSGQQDAIALEPPGDRALLGVAVESVDRAAAELAEHVVAGPEDQPDWGLRVVWLRDPAGNLLELYERIPMSE
jgi:lactoylglutathione lyase